MADLNNLSPEEKNVLAQLFQKANQGPASPAPVAAIDPVEAIKQIGATYGPKQSVNKSGQLEQTVPRQNPLGRLLLGNTRKEAVADPTNYLGTLTSALGPDAANLLPANLPQTPEGGAFVNRDVFDQVMQAAGKTKDSRMLSPEESALTIGYWKEAAPSLVPLAESIVKAKGGLPEWLGKQGPSYRLKRSEFGSVQGFTESGEPVEYDVTEKKWYVAGKETDAKDIGRLLSKTRPQMSEGQVNEVTNLLNAQSSLNEVKHLFDPKAIGPVEDRLLSFQEMTGIKIPDLQGLTVLTDEKVKLRTVLASGINDYIKAVTGAQMSEPEARRIMKALPKPGAEDSAFLPALNEILKVTEMKMNNRLDVLETQDTVGIKKLRELQKGYSDVRKEPPPAPDKGLTSKGTKYRVIK